MSNMLAQRINSNYTIIRDYHETREICFFCNRNNKIKKKRKRIELYKVTAWDSKSINYKMINVDVPRCANCARLQFSNNFFGFLLGSLLLYIIGILIYQIEDWGVLILGFIGLLIIFTFSKFGKFLFSFVYKFTIRILYKIFFHKKFKTKKEIYKSFQPVVDLLSKNWQVNEPKR